MEARRKRFCLNCKTVGSMDENLRFTCKKCGVRHQSNLSAPRLYDRLLVLSGRGGGKTKIGGHAAREEMLQPKGIGWVMGATYKILHDSTFPTLVRLIPPSWIKKWDPEHVEITLTNDHLIAFRSLDDPERARGPHGVNWGWIDEAAQAPLRAYHVFRPTLLKAGGIFIATTTVMGYDWTYDEIEKRAQVYHSPGYWSTRYWTEENPVFRSNPVAMRQIEEDRKTMPPEFFEQEYHAERHNATGLVYDYKILERQYLTDAAAVRKFIPEWPNIDPSRSRIVGLDSGADHPFGATLIVATELGLVVVYDYLERMKAISQHLGAICTGFQITPSAGDITWAANKNEANLRLEFGLKNVPVVPAEAKHEVGIQRVQSWLYSGKLYFAYTAQRTYDQFRAYRYADNTATDGQKKKEGVFKFKDELPDAVRYALMAWPELPEAAAQLSTREVSRWQHLDERSRYDIENMREFNKRDAAKDLEETDPSYPLGEFFNESGHVESLFGE